MKTFKIHSIIRNTSKYPINTVWENAIDLEHVSYLHRKTNHAFKLLHTEKSTSQKGEYQFLVYHATRKLFFFRLSAFGFRKIIQVNQLHQMEFIPILKITSCLNSTLKRSEINPETTTEMVDEIILEVPVILYYFRNWIKRSLERHAKLQCDEDEPYRERRTLLKQKGIQLPYKLFNESEMTRFNSFFNCLPDSE